ncbi:hypothetical protein AB0I00_08635 [Streptomyces sp. NPDC050803]|uniref:ATP-binding protein n=1 Tax=unclassified Streptomyces TaxID=2593676 RepID=UPI003424D947
MSGKSREPGRGTPGNLPPEAHGFVGRSAELAWLAAELASEGGGRAVSLVGPGGVGKTGLALRAAGRAREAYPDGAWLVELSALHAEGLVPLAVMEALGLADGTTRPAAEAVVAWARDKRLLLILDSCEHLLADCAALTAELTAAAPGVRVLATSRARLGLPQERTLTVDPLPVGDPETGEQADADALFAERAARAVPGFTLDAATRRPVAQACRSLDGVPLAIELAAARLSELPLPELLSRLGARSSRFDLLTSDSAEGLPRHHALRTTIGWSHELCAPLERLLWARLSVFAGSFARDAATRVCAGGPLPAEQVERLLDRLVACSIVQPDHADPARFRMLDTVREYGADWLCELGEEQAVRQRHRDYYRRLAREAWSEWNAGRQVHWSRWALVEHANLRGALDCALDGPDRDLALEMAGDIGFVWRHCGHLREARHCLDQVLAHDPPPGPARTRALWARGAVAIVQGDLDTLARFVARCADEARAEADPAVQAAAMYLEGSRLVLSGLPDEAAAILTTAPRVPPRADGFGAVQLQLRLTLAFAHQLRGEHEASRAVAVEVREASGERGSWEGTAADYLVAQSDLVRGDASAAARSARSAIANSAAIRNVVVSAIALDALAAALLATGENHRAARVLGLATHVWELTGGDQMSSPDLLAARRSHELRLRAAIGDAAYERAFAEGRAMSYEEGVEYAASG